MQFREPINLETDDFMDVLEAKQVASDFHGGQNSALYSFASTGKLYYPNAYYINELKKVSDESLEAYGDSQEAITDKYRLIEFFKVQPEESNELLTESVKYKLFKNFMESLKTHNPALIESVKRGFDIMFENGNGFTNNFDYKDDTYTITAETPESVMSIIKESPTLINALKEKNIPLDLNTVKSMELTLTTDTSGVSGEGYKNYGYGHRRVWDEPPEEEGGVFEDGILAEIESIGAYLTIETDTGSDEIQIELSPEADAQVFELMKSTIESDESVYEKLLEQQDSSYNDRDYDDRDYYY